MLQVLKAAICGDDDFYRNAILGDFGLSPLFSLALCRRGKRDALESAALDLFSSLKGTVVQDALRGPYKSICSLVRSTVSLITVAPLLKFIIRFAFACSWMKRCSGF
jgi:hypothetical protein